MDRLYAFTRELHQEIQQLAVFDDHTTVIRDSAVARLAAEVAGELDLELQSPVTFGHIRRLMSEAQAELQAAA